jgi:hypothetical protein
MVQYGRLIELGLKVKANEVAALMQRQLYSLVRNVIHRYAAFPKNRN